MESLPRASRTSDPASSVAAEVEINASGSRQRQIDAVIDAVNKHPGSTAHEIASHIPWLDHVQVSRRLSDARHMGKVQNGQKMRQCLVVQRMSLSWYPV